MANPNKWILGEDGLYYSVFVNNVGHLVAEINPFKKPKFRVVNIIKELPDEILIKAKQNGTKIERQASKKTRELTKVKEAMKRLAGHSQNNEFSRQARHKARKENLAASEQLGA